MQRFFVASAFALVSLALASNARAQASVYPPPIPAQPQTQPRNQPRNQTESVYYGGSLILADVASAGGGIVLSIASRSLIPAILALVTYVGVPPAIHFAHDEPLHAGVSMGLR